MKNIQNRNPFEKINAVYIILYTVYFIYFINACFTWIKAIVLAVGLFIAFALLILETYYNNKN